MHVLMGSRAPLPAAAIAPFPAAAPAAAVLAVPGAAALPDAPVIAVVGVDAVVPALAALVLLPLVPAFAVVLVPLPAAEAFAPDVGMLVGDVVLSAPAGVTFVAGPELEQPAKKTMRIDPSARSDAGLTVVRWFITYLATSLAFSREALSKTRRIMPPRVTQSTRVSASSLRQAFVAFNSERAKSLYAPTIVRTVQRSSAREANLSGDSRGR